jgi:hypothetical protein
MLLRKALCREYALLGQEMRGRQHHDKGLAYATAARPTFIFGKVDTTTPACPSTAAETRTIRARLAPAR